MNVSQITGTTVNANDSIGSQIEKAKKIWGNSIPGLQLTWNNNQVSPALACDPDTLPSGYTCENTPQAHLDNFDAPASCSPTIGWAVLTTRWPNAPDQSVGANILFTNSITADPPNPLFDIIETVPFYDVSLCPKAGIGNDIVMSNQAYNYTLAHAVGHVFGLLDVRGQAAANPSGNSNSNLMCSYDSTYCPDPGHHGTFLNPGQIAAASRGLVQWISKTQ